MPTPPAITWIPIEEYSASGFDDKSTNVIVGWFYTDGKHRRWCAESAHYSTNIGWVALDGRIVYPSHFAHGCPE